MVDFQHENWAYYIHFEYAQKFHEKVMSVNAHFNMAANTIMNFVK